MLRVRGESATADELRAGALEDLLAAIRTTGVGDEVIATRLETILSAEDERVANAMVLAEVLAPILAEQLGSRVESIVATASPAPPAATVSPPAHPPLRTAGDAPPAAGIADFIDQMIAQEKPPTRQPPQRRAS